MKHLFIVMLILLSGSLSGQKPAGSQSVKKPSVKPEMQKPVSVVDFSDHKTQILVARKEAMKATGKLNTGEGLMVGCDQGSCYFEIDYKGRSVRQTVGSEIGILTLYEFDFGGDGDFEIVAVNDIKGTSWMYVVSYSRGMIQELFEKEIKNLKMVIKKDYLEYQIPGGQPELWNFYQGQFWKMTPFKKE